MSLNSVLTMLFGAALVAIGVLASALADRIRGLKISRESQHHERASRVRSAISVVESAAPLRATPAPVKPPRAQRDAAKAVTPEGGEEVIAVLVASGHKKPIATEATWACTAAERATIEGWTMAAFRRCAQGGMS